MRKKARTACNFAGNNLVRARQQNDLTAGIESQTFPPAGRCLAVLSKMTARTVTTITKTVGAHTRSPKRTGRPIGPFFFTIESPNGCHGCRQGILR
jgi:hypothetical protein